MQDLKYLKSQISDLLKISNDKKIKEELYYDFLKKDVLPLMIKDEDYITEYNSHKHTLTLTISSDKFTEDQLTMMLGILLQNKNN